MPCKPLIVWQVFKFLLIILHIKTDLKALSWLMIVLITTKQEVWHKIGFQYISLVAKDDVKGYRLVRMCSVTKLVEWCNQMSWRIVMLFTSGFLCIQTAVIVEFLLIAALCTVHSLKDHLRYDMKILSTHCSPPPLTCNRVGTSGGSLYYRQQTFLERHSSTHIAASR